MTEKKDKKASQLPKPQGYRLLIALPEISDTTDGGIIKHTADTKKAEEVASVCGYVLELGPDAYKDQNRFPNGPYCKKGDWVIFGRYAGARFQIEGGDMRLLNDDEILAVVDDPEAIIS